MKEEIEITVQINCNYEELHKILIDNNFEIKEEYESFDDYMIPNNINIYKLKTLDILKNCILIRNIHGIKKELLYKYKEYNSNGDIIKQGKIECPVIDIKKATLFMKAINYKKLFSIYDKCIVYANDKTELTVQLVNHRYIFIEMEYKFNYIHKQFKNIDEMINEISKYNLPYNNNYFVKKAEIVLNSILKKND